MPPRTRRRQCDAELTNDDVVVGSSAMSDIILSFFGARASQLFRLALHLKKKVGVLLHFFIPFSQLSLSFSLSLSRGREKTTTTTKKKKKER